MSDQTYCIDCRDSSKSSEQVNVNVATLTREFTLFESCWGSFFSPNQPGYGASWVRILAELEKM